ncbi:hypothetical protein M406DRAFT_351253 [Cryphonectria parasitica EP155]|uniref:Uncharacterized protein n=1 Tax=Cryphonectria parasitica (strain ATCC 38755 / EP155) TaxID=660469 RepID=A0A9P4Y2V8_CRYP1|nr:uncharacterized protein M406DRAFT_351253 [Cryphonectria parasitica EP155]KAF3765967.1 hypothetical protein M406DRAFT_351253 [Cryphonectria parasitica EP155]
MGQKSKKRAGDGDGSNAIPKNKRYRGMNRDWSQYTHVPPKQSDLAQNGRKIGRNLIAWNRPRMMEKLILHMEYECQLRNISVPWDNIAHRLNPGSSGSSVQQQLVRLRKTLIAEGHLVPPVLQKPGTQKPDPAIRGYVRRFQDASGDYETIRPVRWTEEMDDLKKGLGDAAYADVDGTVDKSADATDLGLLDGLLDAAAHVTETGDSDVFVENPNIQKKSKSKPKRKKISNQSPDDEDDEALVASNNKRKKSVALRPTRAAAKKKTNYAEPESDDDSIQGVKENELTDKGEDDVNQKEGAANEDTTLTATPGATPVFTAQSQAAFQQVFGTPTPKRGGGRFTDGTAEPGGMVLMGPIFPVTPDGGKTWGYATMAPGGLNAIQPIAFPSTPVAAAAPCFTTASSSPASFDMASATPHTATAMRTHMNEWNAGIIRPAMLSNGGFDMPMLSSVSGPSFQEDPNRALDFPSMFSDTDEFAAQLKKVQKDD